MKKKKILIFNYFMYIGGAERALLGLLNTIDYTKYDVDLFLAMHMGEFMKLIPEEVYLLPENSRYAGYACPLKDVLFSKDFMIGLARLNAKRKFKTYMKQKGIAQSDAAFQYVVREMMPFLPEINPQVEYDLAISFIAPHNIVAEKVRAKKKLCWIHTDYTRIDVNVDMELPVWSKYNHVMSISPDVSKTFLQVFPSLKEKIVEFENILSPVFVRNCADEFDASAQFAKLGGGNCKAINILSIGRFSHQKNFENVADIFRKVIEEMTRLLSIGRFSEAKKYDNVPEICRQVNELLIKTNTDEKVEVKWFLIGWGGGEELIRQKIAEAGMEKNLIILGKQSNPYPYIKACDIYVQPSRYEGKSVTVREAQILCKPVVVTNYPTASSQIKDGVDGRIVPLDNEGCAKGLADFILNKELQDKIVEHLQHHDYGNESEIEKLYQLVP